MARDNRTLTVSMVAEVSSLRKGFASARKELSLMQKSSQLASAAMTGAFAGAGAVAAIVSIQAIVGAVRSAVDTFKETATMIEDTKHLADALGATTEEMQVLQRAAQLAEVDMDMLGRNVKILTKNLGQASMGKGPAADMLKQLGLDARQLIQMSLPEQMTAIGQKFAGLGSAAQRAAAATAIFGKSGIDMIPFLMQAADSLQDVQAEMIATGEVFSDTDAAMVDEMGDSVTMAWGIWNAFKNQLVIQVAPAIKYLADLVRDWAKTTDGGVRNLVSDGLAYLVDGIARVIDTVYKLQSVWYGLKAAVLLIASALTWAWKSFAAGFRVIIFNTQEVFLGMIKVVLSGIDKLTGAIASIGGMAGIPGFESGTNFAGAIDSYVQDATNARKQAMMDAALVADDPFLQSLAKDSGDALNKAIELWGKKSTLGDDFRKKAAEVLGTTIEDTPMKEFYDESLDILPNLEKEKEMRDGIRDTLQESADLANEIKDAGEGKGFRTGEFVNFQGSVTGGMPVSKPSAIGVTGAVAASRMGTGGVEGGESRGILQGILEATRATAMNTAQRQVATFA
jgi:hypothetical protein